MEGSIDFVLLGINSLKYQHPELSTSVDFTKMFIKTYPKCA